MIALLVVIMGLPFMQIGLSYWVSGQVFLLFTLFFAGAGTVSKYFLSNGFVLRMLAAYGLLMAILLYDFGPTNSSILRTGREALCFFLISGAALLQLSLSRGNVTQIVRIFQILVTCLLVLVIVQTLFLARGVYIGLPQDLFVINADTLPDELDLIYSRIRPMGPYGEPSYLAAVSLTVMFGLRKLWALDGRARFVILALLLIVYMSRSLSGIVWATLLFGAIAMQARNAGWIILLAVCGGAGAILGTVYLELGVFERLGDISSGQDVSFAVRITEPFRAIPKIFNEYPIGVPPAILNKMVYILEERIQVRFLVQNSMILILINYGVFGLFALVVLGLSYAQRPAALFLIAALMIQNGSFFSIDKVVLVSLAMILSNSIQAMLNAQDPPEQEGARTG